MNVQEYAVEKLTYAQLRNRCATSLPATNTKNVHMHPNGSTAIVTGREMYAHGIGTED